MENTTLLPEINIEIGNRNGSEHQGEGRHAETETEGFVPEPHTAQKMRLVEARVYRGPNPYGYRPVVRFKIDLGLLEQFPTTQLGDFTDRLLTLIPTLQTHGCSYGEAGRPGAAACAKGTWLGHVTEHVAMELQCLAGTPVTYGKTRSTRTSEPGVYNVIYSYTGRARRPAGRAGWPCAWSIPCCRSNLQRHRGTWTFDAAVRHACLCLRNRTRPLIFARGTRRADPRGRAHARSAPPRSRW